MEKITAKTLVNNTEITAFTNKDNHEHGFVYSIDKAYVHKHKITTSSWCGFINKQLFDSKKKAAAYLNTVLRIGYHNVSVRNMAA